MRLFSTNNYTVLSTPKSALQFGTGSHSPTTPVTPASDAEKGDHFVSAQEAQPSCKTTPLTSIPEDSESTQGYKKSPWLQVIEDWLADASPTQERIHGIPVAELFYLRETLRRTPPGPEIDTRGKAQELYPCPFPGKPSPPWALLDRDTVGSDHPDSKRFWDIVDGKNTPKDLLDKISKRQVKIGPKGQVSFPSPTIKRPKIWWGQNGSQQSKKGKQGDNGEPKSQPGISSQPGKKQGDVIGKKPGKQKGPGSGQGEGEGDYPKELWSPPMPRSQVAKLLQSQWGLPFIQPRGKGKMKETREIWDQTTITPPNLIERHATLKNAIQRSYAIALHDKPLSMMERIQNGMHPGSEPIENYQISITGNTLVGTQTLQKAVYAFQGKPLGYDDLIQILNQLDRKYHAMGFATSKAIIPPQRLDSGELKIDVREVRDSFSPLHIQVHRKDNVRIAAREESRPVAKTALIYIMDVSGSVGNDMKEMARVQNYFLDTHLMHQYGLVAANLAHEKYDDKKHFGQGVGRRFIVHTDGAQEASEEEFYTTGQSGGTRISSGFELAKTMIQKDFPIKDWNVYIFYQGDGDNIGGDNDKSIKLMQDLLDQGINMIGYTHLAPYTEGSTSQSDGLSKGNFFNAVKHKLGKRENVRTSILHRPEINEYQKSIQKLLAEKPSGAKK